MFRATTPLHTFVFPDDPETYSEVLITYSQNGRVVLEKFKKDLTFTTEDRDGVMYYPGSFRLTEAEANKFSAKGVNERADVQVRVLTEDGLVMASEIKTIPIKEVLDARILTPHTNPVVAS